MHACRHGVALPGSPDNSARMESGPDAPLVVGTVRPDGLAGLAVLPPAERGADIVEARFDLAMPPAGSAGAAVPPDPTVYFPA